MKEQHLESVSVDIKVEFRLLLAFLLSCETKGVGGENPPPAGGDEM